jgi:hypothetical protein
VSDIPEEEELEFLYKPPGKSEHYALDKVLDNIYHRIELLEQSMDSIFNLKID